ncbi:hypothetical protein GCM10023209_22730 [Roseibacterium beibuensis]|uniref:Uncharacterized protein n=1 Tax=[Roseibacterium] beibuensis TaxID=1193142 RepID=A0ABP9LCL1_9RHOB
MAWVEPVSAMAVQPRAAAASAVPRAARRVKEERVMGLSFRLGFQEGRGRAEERRDSWGARPRDQDRGLSPG